jgi:hypothetical protein
MLIGATLEEAQDAAQAALTDLLDRAMRGMVIRRPYAYARTAMWRYFVSQRATDSGAELPTNTSLNLWSVSGALLLIRFL